jgi:predicted transcriptional regulator
MKYIKLFTEDLKGKNLSLFDKAVLGSLITKYQFHGCKEFYTYENFIADELEIGEATVKRSIKKLNEAGLISINKKYDSKLRKTINFYTVNFNTEDDKHIKEEEISEEKPNVSLIDTFTELSNEEQKKEAVDEIYETLDYTMKSKYKLIKETIGELYNLDTKTYFKQFKDMFSLGYTNLEKIAHEATDTTTKVTPDDVLVVYKAVKECQC